MPDTLKKFGKVLVLVAVVIILGVTAWYGWMFLERLFGVPLFLKRIFIVVMALLFLGLILYELGDIFKKE
jgi:FtsH-binding integral membrane protein